MKQHHKHRFKDIQSQDNNQANQSTMVYKQNNPSNPTDPRNGPTCFRCGEQGHMRGECRKRVFCNHCRRYNHNTKACRKQHENTPSPTHSQIATGYHPTATPPPLMGTAAATQPTEPHNNPLFNLLDNNQPRTSTQMGHTTERHVTGHTSRFNRRNNTDHEPSHRRQQERRRQQKNGEKTSRSSTAAIRQNASLGSAK